MASPVAHSLPDSITTALVRSIKIVPSSAVPSIVDCVLATTGLSPSSLFDSLIKAFPDFLKGHMQETSSLVVSSSEQVTSFTMSLLYLLQKLGFECTALRSFICTAYIPVLKIINPNDSTLVCQVVELLFGNVDTADIWEVMMSTLVPCCLNSLNTHPSVKSQNKVTFTSSDHSILMESKSQNCLVPNHNAMQILSGNLPIRTACYQLSLLLTSASNGCQMAGRCVGVKRANEENPRGVIFEQLHCILSNVTVMMLSQDSDMRTSAIRVLLPTIFRAYDSCTSIQFSLHGGEDINSRGDFSRKIWKCCKLLLLARHQERYDGYLLLSCNFHSFIPSDDCEAFNSNSHNEEKFDIRADNIFWEEMRNGLVDKEAPVRKQALYILKLAVSTYSDCLCEFDTCNPNSVSKIKNPPVEISSNGNAGNLLMTKREKWAAKEAHSLGVELASNSAEPCYTGQQRWAAFLLLYEMLEEYGTHLVEASWNHQALVGERVAILTFPFINGDIVKLLFVSRLPDRLVAFLFWAFTRLQEFRHTQHLPSSNGDIAFFFSWLAVLWERGLCHGNPQVRCLIMQSFVNIKWEKHGDYARSVPKDFVLGPLMEGLNDPVHHKDFGLKDVYCSETIKGVANFFSSLSGYLSWERGNFLCGFVTIVKKESYSRAGLMALATCIASFARGCGSHNSEAGTFKRISCDDGLESVHGVAVGKKLLYILQLIIEKSKHHFNPNYRLKVCDWALIAASTLVVATEVPIDLLLNFIWCFPREFTDIDGPLRKSVCDWFHQSSLASSCIETSLLKKLYDFPENFIMDNSCHTFDTFDDDDLSIWKLRAQRWARMLFLTLSKENQLEHIFSFIRKHGLMINQQHPCKTWSITKFLLLSIGLIEEYKVYKLKISELSAKTKSVKATGNNHASSDVDFNPFSTLCEKFPEPFLHILEELVLLARSASVIFWSSNVVHSGSLPGSVTGKLGGPSQRRLTTFSATMLLQAIVSVKAVTSVLTLCGGSEYIMVASAIEFLWNYTWKVVTLPPPETEAGAEVYLAAYEALADVLAASLATFSFAAVHSKLMDRKTSIREIFKKKGLEYFLNRFLDCINELVAVRALARSRRAILIHWKWHCLHLILCIPSCILHNGVQLEDTFPYISHATLQRVFVDAVDSLENASEDSFLPMLRSIKSVLELRYSIKTIVCDLAQSESEIEVLWKLVKSAWTSHANCNKRRIAPIASLLSSILHPFVFSDLRMHKTVDCNPGPLKWFVEKIVSEGAKSPRTIRLAALHLTGLWFLFPMTINYYMKELKLLTFYGSVAFDEDFEASITENDDARREYLLLARSPDPELVKAFTNTEMYARVSVAVLFHKLFELAGESEGENKDAILHCGKTFLLLLLESVVNDNDLAKELYKKYSRVHRHKVRAWQMICVLSQFVDTDVLQQVISSLNICLYRNNLPAVRQYLETFAINIYLKFPSMIEEQLVPIFLDSNIRPQALSSYVFIAANVILHSTEGHAQLRCLNELLPPIVPFLTSHHHSLRGFTQILVYHVLNRLLPAYDAKTSIGTSLEAKCFETLKAYLHENADCRRLRTSLQGFLDAFDPSLTATPKGIFSSIDEDIEFECVPTALMDQVTDFLNDAREDLRVSIANDERILRNEGIAVMQSNGFAASSGYPKDLSLNFQKKLTIDKILGDPNSLSDVEEEDQLMYTMALLGRKTELFKEGRQELILVASLLDRIPNLAGLARTCEVFRASALAVADKSIAQDKQFQLISVTAEKWVPIIEVPVFSIKVFLDKKKREGFSLVGLEQTANSVPLDQYSFPRRTVLVLGREKEGIPVDIIHILDACVEIPQLGVVRSLNVHVSGAIAIWEYTRQQRVK